MKKQLISLGILLILLFAVGGFTALFQGVDVIAQVFLHIIPVFAPLFEQALFDYLKSPYFIAGVVILILSAFGVAYLLPFSPFARSTAPKLAARPIQVVDTGHLI